MIRGEFLTLEEMINLIKEFNLDEKEGTVKVVYYIPLQNYLNNNGGGIL